MHENSYAHVLSLHNLYPFQELKTIFIDFAYHPVTKIINNFCIVFHSLSLILEFIFIYENFSVELLLRYGCFIAVLLFVCYLIKKKLLLIITLFIDNFSNDIW